MFALWFTCAWLYLVVEKLKCAAVYTHSNEMTSRTKRVVSGTPVLDLNSDYASVRYVVWMSSGHDCERLSNSDIKALVEVENKNKDLTIAFTSCAPNPLLNVCAGSLLTPSLVQTACHCIVNFEGELTNGFWKAVTYRVWEDMYDIYPERLNVLYVQNWTRLVTEQLRQLEADVVQTMRRESLAESDHQWSFSGSLLYSLTIITTIGCGKLGPRTVEGKLATMVYALVGVPLMLVCLTHLGGQLADLIHTVYSLLCTCPHKRSPSNDRMEYQLEERGCKMRSVEVVGGGCGRAVCRLTSLDSMLDYPRAATAHDSDEDDTELCRGPALNDTPSRMPLIWRGGSEMGRPGTPPPPRMAPPPPPRRPPVPPLVAVLLIVLYVCAGAWFFTTWGERRSYLEGLYFTFTALTTIGLSDLVPSRHKKADSQLQLLAVCLYILFGLILIATAFALVQEQVVSKTRQIAISLGVVKREELPV